MDYVEGLFTGLTRLSGPVDPKRFALTVVANCYRRSILNCVHSDGGEG